MLLRKPKKSAVTIGKKNRKSMELNNMEQENLSLVFGKQTGFGRQYCVA